MFGLRKKPALPPPPAPERVPTDRVMQLSQQGFSDPEIIRTLREEGYKPTEVDKALKIALKTTAFGGGPQFPGPVAPRRPSLSDELDEEGPVRSDLALPDLPWQKQQRPIPPAPPSFEPLRPAPEAPAPVAEETPQLAPSPWAAPPARPAPRPAPRRPLPLNDDLEEVPTLPGRRALPPTAKRDSVAEVVEAVIEEKWDAMQGELESLEHRIKALEDHLQIAGAPAADTHELQQKLDAAHQQTAELSAKMDAMERVLKDSLTPMMETMRSLTDALRELKQSRA